MRTFDECVNYIMDIPKFQGKNTLEDTHRFIDDDALSGVKIINVAGSNGKGSVSSYIASILRRSNKKVAVFTSPHLVDIRERICIDGIMISKDDFCIEFEKVLEYIKCNRGAHPSFFEFLFIMGMNYFSRKNVDYIILEAGMGGRLDATNCIRNRSLSVITQIGLDHTEYLGDTIALIANEKAGIIENDIPVVFWNNEDDSKEVIKSVAKSRNSDAFSVCKKDITDVSVTKVGIDFSLHCEYYYFEGLHINTCAPYQAYNASLAVLAALKLEDKDIDEKSIRQGLSDMKWPARMEEIYKDVYLDGAHNPNGTEAFLEAVKAIPVLNESKRILLFGVVNDKDYDLMSSLILASGLFDEIILSPIDSKRGLSSQKLSEIFNNGNENNKLRIIVTDSVKEGMDKLLSEKKDNDICFIAGSLYLAGEVKALMALGE